MTGTWLCSCGATNATAKTRCHTCKKHRFSTYHCTHQGPCREWNHSDGHVGFTLTPETS